jgi:hypothetical protein
MRDQGIMRNIKRNVRKVFIILYNVFGRGGVSLSNRLES